MFIRIVLTLAFCSPVICQLVFFVTVVGVLSLCSFFLVENLHCGLLPPWSFIVFFITFDILRGSFYSSVLCQNGVFTVVFSDCVVLSCGVLALAVCPCGLLSPCFCHCCVQSVSCFYQSGSNTGFFVTMGWCRLNILSVWLLETSIFRLVLFCRVVFHHCGKIVVGFFSVGMFLPWCWATVFFSLYCIFNSRLVCCGILSVWSFLSSGVRWLCLLSCGVLSLLCFVTPVNVFVVNCHCWTSSLCLFGIFVFCDWNCSWLWTLVRWFFVTLVNCQCGSSSLSFHVLRFFVLWIFVMCFFLSRWFSPPFWCLVILFHWSFLSPW